ncbi:MULTISPECIES: hypothetical protein [unclassified Pseudomonas]|uniref:hypothetical protein n=1 Tax=unclassified Pseudomonas TaxID=196821 RepID=UPI00093FFD64|nr:MULTISPECIES: hypothetical protein [unclassified Pseudomonas]PMZ68058.1 hypothetical protein C1X25_24900 [Pseudomonas sp. GW247-3R2A]OKO50307.1 hypothetical protein BMH52_01055 [Pseudomonas sp. BTN1]PMY71965.1 hypothetical protein C1X26_15650 [Pseudomonas sp. MPR-R3A]PMY98814.1 hypothetical protein C1X24_07000 [Pseudomonas sp. FW305-124]PNA94123.1 hypothetical protein C1X23_09250 [Pseudomonas sp. FW300-E2]
MSQIKERPILFSAPMVRAILEGRKTVTRRTVKATKAHADGFIMLDHGKGGWPYNAFGDFTSDHEGMEYPIACPYGKPGDRLWVRETWARVGNCDPGYLTFGATYPACLPPKLENIPAASEIRWKPSIHMFRRDSRILLEITEVRVERLQDISRADIRAEGLLCPPELASDDVSPNYRDWYPAAWRELWESTGGDWNANPWVWVVEFKRVTP